MWIKTDYWFGDRCALLTMTSREAILAGMEKMLESEKPDDIENDLLELIVCHRPELKGCVLVSIGYDPRDMKWRLTVTHESLPKRQSHECPVEMPLITKVFDFNWWGHSTCPEPAIVAANNGGWEQS